MKKAKTIITTLTAAAIAASICAVSASELVTPATQRIETEKCAENIITYTFHVPENSADLHKGGENYTITFTSSEDVTLSCASDAGSLAETDVYYTAKDADITYSAGDDEHSQFMRYIIKTENGKTLISSDNGKTWMEVEVDTQTSDAV